MSTTDLIDKAAVSLTDALSAQVRRTPDATAIVDGHTTLTYAQLWQEIHVARSSLAGLGIGGGDVVCIRIARGSRQIAALAAVLSLGATYVPVDINYPDARQQHIINDSGAAAVMGVGDHDIGYRVDVIDADHSLSERETVPAGTAYIMYTSGSSGRPKGVMVAHRHILEMLRGCYERFSFSSADSWTLFHSFSFDFSVWELWGCLLTGGRLVIVRYETAIDPELFLELLSAHQISVLNLVPSTFAMISEVARAMKVELPALRYLIFGGEAIQRGPVNAWYDAKIAPTCTIVNMYGITETTVHVTYCELTLPLQLTGAATPIGRELPHLEVLVLDEQMEPVPAGGTGEFVISGRSVSAGYWKSHELTKERFHETNGTRFYRSGDLGYRDADGQLLYVGRGDDQVKIRGFRIELAEVEQALRDLPDVADAACVVASSHLGQKHLVAHVVPTSPITDEASLRRVLRAQLAKVLPDHQMPSIFRFRTTLPLTPSGKLDRQQLATTGDEH